MDFIFDYDWNDVFDDYDDWIMDTIYRILFKDIFLDICSGSSS